MSRGWAGPAWGEPSKASEFVVPLRARAGSSDASYRADGGESADFGVRAASVVGVSHRLSSRRCEDAYTWALPGPGRLVLVIADGVSTAGRGAEGAETAVSAARDYLLACPTGGEMECAAAVRAASEELVRVGGASAAELSTTLVVALLSTAERGAEVASPGLGTAPPSFYREANGASFSPTPTRKRCGGRSSRFCRWVVAPARVRSRRPLLPCAQTARLCFSPTASPTRCEMGRARSPPLWPRSSDALFGATWLPWIPPRPPISAVGVARTTERCWSPGFAPWLGATRRRLARRSVRQVAPKPTGPNHLGQTDWAGAAQGDGYFRRHDVHFRRGCQCCRPAGGAIGLGARSPRRGHKLRSQDLVYHGGLPRPADDHCYAVPVRV